MNQNIAHQGRQDDTMGIRSYIKEIIQLHFPSLAPDYARLISVMTIVSMFVAAYLDEYSITLAKCGDQPSYQLPSHDFYLLHGTHLMILVVIVSQCIDNGYDFLAKRFILCCHFLAGAFAIELFWSSRHNEAFCFDQVRPCGWSGNQCFKHSFLYEMHILACFSTMTLIICFIMNFGYWKHVNTRQTDHRIRVLQPVVLRLPHLPGYDSPQAARSPPPPYSSPPDAHPATGSRPFTVSSESTPSDRHPEATSRPHTASAIPQGGDAEPRPMMPATQLEIHTSASGRSPTSQAEQLTTPAHQFPNQSSRNSINPSSRTDFTQASPISPSCDSQQASKSLEFDFPSPASGPSGAHSATRSRTLQTSPQIEKTKMCTLPSSQIPMYINLPHSPPMANSAYVFKGFATLHPITRICSHCGKFNEEETSSGDDPKHFKSPKSLKERKACQHCNTLFKTW